MSHCLALVFVWKLSGGIVEALEEGAHVLVACRGNNPLCTALVSDFVDVR